MELSVTIKGVLLLYFSPRGVLTHKKNKIWGERKEYGDPPPSPLPLSEKIDQIYKYFFLATSQNCVPENVHEIFQTEQSALVDKDLNKTKYLLEELIKLK